MLTLFRSKQIGGWWSAYKQENGRFREARWSRVKATADAISRELVEEAGARLVTFELLGAWHCFSTASKPYRPHLPHPEFYRLVGYGAVEIIGNPENPEGGEQVASVEFVSIEKAVQRFRDINRFELAELYQLAARAREAKNANRREIDI